MRRVAGAVTVVTTRGPNGERRGATATAVCSLTVDPPSVMACINRQTGSAGSRRKAAISPSTCCPPGDVAIAETFAGRTEVEPEARFETGSWRQGDTGAPMLDGALSVFDCQLEKTIEFASHVILIGRVVRTWIGPDEGAPLVYVEGGYTSTRQG